MPCTVFIDESGDAGVSKIRSAGEKGSSDYFVMGAVVLQPASMIVARKLLDSLQEEFQKKKRWRHATDLSHSQKIHFCRQLSQLHIRYFGVISYKPTLGEYAADIEWEPDKFYNKCAKYLLERVGAYLGEVGGDLREPEIVFEERNHNYDAMIRYLGAVKENPLYEHSKALGAINPFGITSKKKSEEDLLRLADLVSHALYCCVNKTPNNFGIVEPRYLNELSPRFAADKKGRVLGAGIKAIHTLADLNLEPEAKDVLTNMRANARPLKRVS